MQPIRETATLTSKGQLTLPKAIRQALGVDVGGKLAFDVSADGQIRVSRVESVHEDPAIGAFLNLLARDIETGQHTGTLPPELAHALLEQTEYAVNLDDPVEGDVVL